jgi:hypothetical protein
MISHQPVPADSISSPQEPERYTPFRSVIIISQGCLMGKVEYLKSKNAFVTIMDT